MKNTIARTLTALGASALFILSASPLTTCAANKITPEQAKQIAMKDAGFTDKDVKTAVVQYDTEDGIAVYDVEFIVKGIEYSYDVRISDGAIIDVDTDVEGVNLLG